MSNDIITQLQDPVVRIKAFENNFPLFFAYHFGREFKDFHKNWMKSLNKKRNVMLVGFRASRKTTIVRGYVVWCIAYKKHPNIIVQSYEDSLSGEWVREVAKMLFSKTIVQDYGYLFPIETRKEELNKRSVSNFESTTGVKVSAKSLGQTIRGANTFDIEEGMSNRPTLLVLDDIDVVKSVMNVDIINQNEKKILGETIQALDPLNRQIIFLGNIIYTDGIVPRFRERYSQEPTRDSYWQPLYEDNINLRPEVFTDEVIEQLKGDGKTSFNQNYLLIPDTLGGGVFQQDYFRYFLLSNFEDITSPLKKNDLKVGLFIDPATSSRDESDDAVVGVVGQHKISKNLYLLDYHAGTNAPSKTYDNVALLYRQYKELGYNIEYISCEDVPLNKAQTQFIEGLERYLLQQGINVPLRKYTPKVDKVYRIKQELEGFMSLGGLMFNKNMQGLNKLEKQFLDFPFGDHDDIIDMLAQARIVFNQTEPTRNRGVVEVSNDEYLM